MKKIPRRLLSTGLALSMLGSLMVVPASAATYTGAEVYDHVLDIYEDDFQKSIKFENGAAGFTGDEWYDQSEVVGINRERAKTQFVSYQDTATALAAEQSVLDDVGPETSAFYQLLSGKEWDFALVYNPATAAEKDAEYLAADYTGTDFQKRYVPQAWQTYRNEDGTFAYKDEPMYTNHPFPWIGNYEGVDYNNPSAPTTYNPVGYYRTTFTTPADWDGREIFISLQSVESAYYLYINGKPVGYSTDCFTAHDFNITDYLNPAGEENTLALKVFRWSIGSWLENQDFIRVSGIYRDVYLYSKDEVEIRDFFFKTEFQNRADENSDVAVTVETDIRGLHNAAEGEYTLSAYLMEDGNETPVARAEDQTVTIAASADKTAEQVLRDRGTTVTSTMTVTNPAKWFPDTPNLYSLVLELKDSGGQVIESVVERVGFREVYKVDIDDAGHEQMQINGRQMILRGINRHDTDPETGHALSYEDYYTDLTLMKQYNLNAVRTSHYPNDQVLYDLADELGLYVCAEANIESHRAAQYGDKVPTGTGSGLPEWVASVLDRVATNTERYKNHASVIMWSLGNEATYSYAPLNDDYGFWVASMYLLKRDPSRLRKYERESENYQHPYVKAEGADPWDVETRKNNIVDVHSTQYSLPGSVASYSGRMPYIHSEYNHSMGQAYGNAKEHWDAIRTNDSVQGGFIWEFIDHTIRTVRIDEEGNREEFWGYGGDWTDTVANDDAFCGDGMVFADRTPSPKMEEAKKVHQQVNFYADNLNVVPGGTIDIRVVNEFENTDLSAFDIQWTLTEDSLTQLGSGTLELSTPHMYGQSLDGKNVKTVTLDIPGGFQPKEGSDYLLTFSVKSTEGKPWAAAGHEIAYEQFQLSFEDETPQTTSEPTVPFEDIQTIGDEMVLTGTTDYGQKFEITLNTEEGTIVSYKLDGEVVMTSGPEQSYYRAQTYNDTTMSDWPNLPLKDAGAYENMSNVSVSVTRNEDDTKVLMAMSGNLAVDASGLMGYNIYGNGEIVVLDQFIPASNFAPSGLPKIGSRMEIAEEYDNLTYYGRGPQETYVDRNSGALVGVYTEKVYDYQDPMGEDSNWVGKKMLRPQENGNHTGVRWTSLTNDEGTGLLVSAQGEIEMSALHYTEEEMNSGSYNSPSNRHTIDVPHRPEIIWSIDLHQHGTADTAFMGHRPLDGYSFATDQSYSYAYRISPINTDDAAELMDKSNEGFSVPSSSYPITGISINGNPVSNFDVNSTDGASYSMTPTESVTEESVTVEGSTDFDVAFNEDGTITVSAVNNYGQVYAYNITLAREGTELPYTVFSGAKVDNFYSGQGADKLIDGNTNTIWHSDWGTGNKPLDRLWFMVELSEPTAINGIRYYPRQDSSNINGAFGDHTVYVSDKPISELTGDPSSEDWTLVATGSWPKTTDWKATAFPQAVTAKSILVYPGSTYGDTDNAFGSGAEFRVTKATAVDTSALTVELNEPYTYVGEEVRPDPVVTTDTGIRLIRGVDYDVTYAGNTAPGTGTMTIALKGAFTGEPITRPFQIVEGEKVALTVENGTVENATAESDGTYLVYAGGKVTVVADEPDEGMMFDRWSSGNASIAFDSAESQTATFTMPGEDAVVTANYVEGYLVTVIGGSLDEAGEITSMKFKAGSSIVVYAQIPEGKVFDHWETDGDDAQLTDAARNPALMNATPARDIVITAVFKTDETYFDLVTELPAVRYLDRPFNLPGNIQVIMGDALVDTNVTWNQGDLAALEEGGVGVYTLSATLDVGRTIEHTVTVLPADVVYFVDNGAENFTDLGQAILDGNSGTVLNDTTDQAYAEGGWGYTNEEYEVEGHADYGLDVYSTIRNMTDNHDEDDPHDGRGKPMVYRFDGLEPGSYRVYIGYKNIWYQPEIQRVANIEFFNSEGAAAEAQQTNLNVAEGQYIVFEDVTVTAGDPAIPEETETPVEEPEVPAEEPETPVEEPEAPVEEPEAPVEEPEAPVEEPEAPVEDPEAPVEDPEAPVEDPEAPVEDPEAPVEDPEAPVEEPEAPVEDILPETTLPSAELVGMSPLAMFLANEGGETGGLILRMSPTAFENANNDMLVSFILITKAESPATVTVTYADGEETLSAQTILSGSTAVRPSDPVKDGFEFDGWYADETLETPYDFSQTLTVDTTVYAKWTATEPQPTPYTVTFRCNNGQADSSVIVAEGNTVPEPAEPVRDGYTFDGWFTDPDCTERYSFDEPVTRSFTLYAGWTADEPGEPDVDEDDEPENSSTVVTRPGESGSSGGGSTDEPGTDIDEPDTPLAPGVFTDVPAGHWAQTAITYVYGQGYFNGTSATTFSPGTPMTRSMLATVLWRMAGQPTPTGANPFTDVPAGQWYTDAVTWAAEQGIVTGIGNGLFDPEGNITREQLAVMLYRYAGSAAASADLSGFADASAISSWASEAVNWAVASGVLSGDEAGRLNPGGAATRAEVAQMLYNYSQA